MKLGKEVRWSVFTALWLLVLTFPLMIIRVDTITNTIDWRWSRLILVGIGGLVVTFLWRLMQRRQEELGTRREASQGPKLLDRGLGLVKLSRGDLQRPAVRYSALGLVFAAAVAYPFLVSIYQTNIMVAALIYVVLALGLNMAVGLAGMLHLGIAAFFAIGAYTYGLLYQYLGWGFWACLPIAAVTSGIAGILLGIPVLRLRGDYLGIVTLAFGEIVRIVLNNWASVTNGPQGIKRIPRPGFFAVEFSITGAMSYTYFIALGIVIIAIFVIYRVENSRLGRNWVAMGEDPVASRAMGVNTTRVKLAAFAISSVFAGIAGVLFAGRTTFINPASFSVWQSVVVLSAVVLGGMGSIPGVVIGALILMLLPEYLRAFADYRMLIFGAVLVVMMVFRPSGIIPRKRRLYKIGVGEAES